MLLLLQLQSFISLGFHLVRESNNYYFMASFLEDDELLLNYLNSSVFLTGNHQLIVAPRKPHILKICQRSTALRANMLVLTTSNFQVATNTLTGGRDEKAVRALASHKCGPGSIPAWCYIWVEFVVGSGLVKRVFLQVDQFFSLHKNQHLQIPI